MSIEKQQPNSGLHLVRELIKLESKARGFRYAARGVSQKRLETVVLCIAADPQRYSPGRFPIDVKACFVEYLRNPDYKLKVSEFPIFARFITWGDCRVPWSTKNYLDGREEISFAERRDAVSRIFYECVDPTLDIMSSKQKLREHLSGDNVAARINVGGPALELIGKSWSKPWP